MTSEEISNCKIVNALYIVDKWKVTVKLNSDFYSFKIDGKKTDSKSTLSDMIYKQLETTEIKKAEPSNDVIKLDDIIGDTPTKK